MPDLHSLLTPRYIFLITGIISLSGAVVSTYTGKSWGRPAGFVYRAKEPKQFWWLVAAYYVIGIWFIASFLGEVYLPSN
jgi:hypothetical protein